MYSRVLFLLGFVVFELITSDSQEQIIETLRSSSPWSCLVQYQTAEDSYGLCSAGCKNSCQEVVCCFPRYTQLPVHGEVQEEYPWDDNVCVCLATTLVCCRCKVLASCSSDSLTDTDVGCITNCFGLDCSPAPGRACELYCPDQRKYGCPVNYVYPTRNNDCCSPSDGVCCCFQSVVNAAPKQMQEPIFVRTRSLVQVTPANIE